jgi:hypothetical protein
MTEFITKEEADLIADEISLYWPAYEDFIDALHKAINLAFAQKLQIVHVTYPDGTHAETLDGKPVILYALKGDSK